MKALIMWTLIKGTVRELMCFNRCQNGTQGKINILHRVTGTVRKGMGNSDSKMPK